MAASIRSRSVLILAWSVAQAQRFGQGNIHSHHGRTMGWQRRAAAASSARQCDISTGSVIEASTERVAPPSTHSRERL